MKRKEGVQENNKKDNKRTYLSHGEQQKHRIEYIFFQCPQQFDPNPLKEKKEKKRKEKKRKEKKRKEKKRKKKKRKEKKRKEKKKIEKN